MVPRAEASVSPKHNYLQAYKLFVATTISYFWRKNISTLFFVEKNSSRGIGVSKCLKPRFKVKLKIINKVAFLREASHLLGRVLHTRGQNRLTRGDKSPSVLSNRREPLVQVDCCTGGVHAEE